MAHRIRHNEYIGVADGQAHFFEITGRDAGGEAASTTKEDFNRWADSPLDLSDYKVIPFGTSNSIPQELQDTIFPNHLSPRIQTRKSDLLFGQGPYLYTQKKDGRQYYREPVEDPEVQDWLESIEHESLLLHNSTEYYYAEQIFTKVRRAKGGRLGQTNAIASLEPLSVVNCRFAYHRNDPRKIPTHVIVGDWNNTGKAEEFDILPLWNIQDPVKHPVAVHYTGFRTFGLSNYVLPTIYGVLPWIKRSTTAPKIIEAFIDNSLNVRYHITSPQKYWDDMEVQLRRNCEAIGEKYTAKMMEDLEEEIFKGLSSVLSGIENVGKFWHNKTVVQLIGGQAVELGWKITPIKQETKEYLESILKVAEKSDFSVVAGMGLHAALANVGADGKSDSGSEQLYARINHEQTGTAIPEMYVCKALNDVLKVKFNRGLRVGFYHVAAQREQDVTSSRRISNTDT